MADEKKKMNGGVIAAICIGVIAVIAVVVTVIVININKSTVVGKYTLTSTIDSEGNESTDSADFLKAFGATYTIEFKDDKTGVLEVGADSSLVSAFTGDEDSEGATTSTTNFTYDDKKLSGSNEVTKFEATYEYKDDTVTLDMNGQKMKFTREGK